MTFDPTPASEEPIDLATLAQHADARHYGWQWRGPEPDVKTTGNGYLKCTCDKAPCGLVARVDRNCEMHSVNRIAAAKQEHKVEECPGG